MIAADHPSRTQSRPVSWVAALDSAGFGLLLLCMALSPLPLGSNRPWAESLLAMGVWLSLLLLMGSHALGGRPWPAALHRARWMLALLGGYCALVGLQWLVGSPQSWLPGTVSEWHTQRYLLRCLCYGAAVLAIVLGVRSRRRCRWVMGTLLTAGVAQACLGILFTRSDAAYVLLFESFGPGGRASGTFANANHFAGFLSLAIAAGIGLLIAQYDGGRGRVRGWRMRLAVLLNFALSLKMVLRLAIVLLVIGLVLSHSRMGNVAFVLALVVSAMTLAYRSEKLRKPALVLLGTMLAIDVLIVGHWIGLERVAERLQGTALTVDGGRASSEAAASLPHGALGREIPPPREESVEQRLQVPLLATQAIWDKPLFGHGGGTFQLSFAPFKPDWVYAGHWNYAHNDFVEVAVDTGLIGLALWLGVGLLGLRRALGLIQDDQPRLNRGVGVAAVFATIATGAQSMMDFGLQIPANAFNFAVLLTLSWVVKGLPLESRGGSSRTDPAARVR
ncbi:MAG: O-antigen ligase family protein [Rubrivivax sp.]|nr:O-antigen ligase family protein [Rubrivivax sp.]